MVTIVIVAAIFVVIHNYQSLISQTNQFSFEWENIQLTKSKFILCFSCTMVKVCDFDELKEYTYSTDDGGDDFISHDDYLVMQQPEVAESVRMPDDYILEHSAISLPTARKSEIPRLLRNAPNILPPTDRFSDKYMPPKPCKQPDVILNGIFNALPVLLDEKYFKFNKDSDSEQMNAMAVDRFNNLNASSSSSGNSGYRFRKLDGSSKTSNSTQDNRKYGLTLSSDDESADDNIKIASDSKNDSTNAAVKNKKQTQIWYNPRQIYDMKRGMKH